MVELLGLTCFVWLAYWGAIRCGFVSDDVEGLQNYDGKLKKLDYGHLNKWILYKLLGKSPTANHLFSIILHNANTLLLYLFLLNFMPDRSAFFTSILFAIHPIGVQSIAWISGRGYPISLFFTLLGLNLVLLLPRMPLNSQNYALMTIGYGCLYYLAIVAQFATLSTFVILAFLGNNFLAVIGVVISLFAGIGIIREVIGIRSKTFKEQNLGSSTYFKLSKIIVALKTLAYYTTLCVFPRQLGLYHTFEYHYSEETEKENGWFWAGFLMLLGFAGLYYLGDSVIKLGILWYFAYIFVFLNWITIHQFVSERYLYIASIGLYTLMGYFLSSFPIAFAFLAGLYLMRTWNHLKTYENEVSFYQSNVWNFPDSEVAFSNLGVTYMKCNLVASAVDMWMISTKINPNYDVGYYNISSTLRSQGQLSKAKEFLVKAIEAKTCHFKDLWKKELEQLDSEMGYIEEMKKIQVQITEAKKDPSRKDKIELLEKQLNDTNNLYQLVDNKRKNDLALVQQEEQSLQVKLINIKKTKENLEKPVSLSEIVKSRNYNFSIIRESVDNLLKVEVPNETQTNRV